MYDFEEEGGLQITTGSDLFSLGIGPIYSAEADFYIQTGRPRFAGRFEVL